MRSVPHRLTSQCAQSPRTGRSRSPNIKGLSALPASWARHDDAHVDITVETSRVAVLELRDGRSVAVRPMCRDDVPALDNLYHRLSPLDIQRRFFCSSSPTPEGVARWASVGEQGGFGLVATTGEAVVAEAAFAPLANGNGEFALTVDPDWRGGLGAQLLDLLCAAAAERGHQNLEGDVLMTNAPMQRLLARRGVAILRHDGPAVRLVTSCTGTTPAWPDDAPRPRLLVEVTSGWWAGEEDALRHGFSVIACRGPGPDRPPCPMTTGGTCPLTECADVILFGLRHRDDTTDAIERRHMASNREVLHTTDAGGVVLGVSTSEDNEVTEAVARIASSVGWRSP